MKYPPINKQPHREVNIPEMSGGLNMRDSVSSVIDNQLIDSLNVWFKDGALRTRPSFATNEKLNLLLGRASSGIPDGIRTFADITKDGNVLMSRDEHEGYTGLGEGWRYTISFWWQGENSLENAGNISIEIPKFEWNGRESLYSIKCSHFVVEKDGILYCYMSAGDNFEVYRFECLKANDKWNRLEQKDFYIPLVATHCLPDGSTTMTEKEIFSSATAFEGYNLLSGRYKMIYSTVNPNLLSESVTTHWAQYSLLYNTRDYIGETVEVNITNSDGNTYKHRVAIKENGWSEEDTAPEPTDDGLRLRVFGKILKIHVFTDGNIGDLKSFGESDYIEDNMEIIAPGPIDTNALRKVFGMTRSTWFGGSANGLSDGSRLFLCGNTNESEQSLVLWSGLNDPTYFPENNYVYVGNKTEPVKAFGKQDNKLVVFKPNETYYTYYVQNNNITAEDLINQTVVDYQANSVYFPFVLLNGSIGCDCPDTVQLCRNRLVWAHSKGKVYTLVSDNQYNENSIYPVAEMVERGIKEFKDWLSTAKSCDFDGHYMLILGQDAFVMDYNSYGYQYVHSYSKSEDANVKIPWYRWMFPIKVMEGAVYYSIGESIAMTQWQETDTGSAIMSAIMKSDNSSGEDSCFICDSYSGSFTENKNPITSRFTTKLFDFSGFRFRKNVDRVSIGFGNNGGAPITVRFVTDVGTEEENVSLSGNELTAYRPSYITVKQFNPCIRSIIRFGVEVECNGLLAVDAINLSYRLLGGAR